MRVIFLPETWTIIICIILWPIFQASAAVLCLKIPDRFFSPKLFFYKVHTWEKDGKIYTKIFKVHRWKRFLPDGGAVMKAGYKKKYIVDFSKNNLQKFLVESCRGELSHWLAIFPFWLFGLIAPPQVMWLMLAYALIINLPCIIVQRYNRPRVLRLLYKNIL
jgi:glycosyl-4,4'-diaponeurosporenoate acyltransferase